MFHSLRPVVSALLVSLMPAGPRAQAGHYTVSYNYTFTPSANTTGPAHDHNR